MKNIKLFISFLTFSFCFFGFSQNPWINEIHYDNNSGDQNEGIEVAIPNGYVCGGTLQIVLYNGSNGTLYNTTTVNTSNSTVTNGVTFAWTPITGIQNGDPDGVALVCNGSVIQFLSYEGTFTATNGPANGLFSTNIGSESGTTPIGTSLQLQGSGSQYSDFSWNTNITSTHDAINNGQNITSPTDPSITVTPNTLSGLDYVLSSGPSPSQTFTVEGTLLLTPIVISAPTNYEVSLTAGSGYTNSINLTPIGTTVANTTIYTRLVSGLTVNSYTGTITATTTGASQNVTVSGEVTAPIADVVITEISYNTAGTDDEWVEICNISGSTQDISGYVIGDIGDTFTFPAATTIANNTCITISLGSNGDGTYNNSCPFTPDFGIGAGTSNSNNLSNSSGTITLTASDGTTIVDSVSYDDADGADGNGSTLHVIDATVNNANTGTNWQQVPDGGSPSTNSLASPCSLPEIQLVDSSNGNQSCGFTLNSGFQATGFNTETTFTIENSGTLNLNVTSLSLSGINADQYSIVSPTTAFVVPSGGGTQLVTIQFSPSSTGTKNATLTINSDDSDESSCTVNLEGIGTTPVQEINVERNTTATIPSGSLANTGFNTVFAATPIATTTTEKTYFVHNTGTANLEVTSITSNSSEFTIITNPTPSTITPGNSITFEITFTPSASGTRDGVITIINNDSDEGTYTFNVRGTGTCNATSVTSIPTSGPENTLVTITGTNLSSATATVGGVSATVNNLDATTMEVVIPAGAEAGDIEITNDLGCIVTAPFNVTTTSGSCGEVSDLMMTQFYDGSSDIGYIEIFNGTNNTIDLTNYKIERFTDAADTVPNDFIFPSGLSINSNQVLVGKLGNTPGPITEDFILDTSGINEEDIFNLYNGLNIIDVFVVPTTASGYNYRRDVNTTGPNATSNPSDWVAESGTTDLGNFAFNAPTSFPSITTQPNVISSCSDVSFSITATPGNSGTLTYQWLYNEDLTDGWNNVNSANFTTGTVTGETTSTLTISNFDITGYQFYCLVTEDSLCSIASNATKSNPTTTTWTGTWSNGTPNINTQAIISANYETSTHGSFSACSLVINHNTSGTEYRLTVNNSTFVEIENDVTVAGELYVETQGNFVQNSETSSFTLTGTGISLVNKSTPPLNSVFEYTYWSSPAANVTVANGLAFANPQRRFWFNAANFEDVLIENGNTNTFIAGSDDIDDDGNDWAFINSTNAATFIMEPGMGFASTHSNLGFTYGAQYTYTFEGPLNNGTYINTLEYNGANGDNDWNLLGNPYPGAIDAYAFLNENSSNVNGSIYLWSQNTLASGNASGNQGQNFTNADYAIITLNSGNTAGGDGIIPTNYIPSGQGFFIHALANADVVFFNSMRVADQTSNNQFFRNSTSPTNRLWLNLTSDTNIFNQMLVAYVDGATSAYDGGSFEAPKSLGSGVSAMIYTKIENDPRSFAIQGKNPNSLNVDEVIPVSFKSNVTTATLYTISIDNFEGEFLNNNTIYLKDNYTSTIHDLKTLDYTFTSEAGEFDNRFEIVFNTNSLSVKENKIALNTIKIIELGNDKVQFLVAKDSTIKTIIIYDALGKAIYNLKGNSNTETYNLSKLSKAPYIAQIELSNGIIVSKKAIKQ